MKLLIVGSRTITDFDLEGHVQPNVDLIISGGAKGIDTVAEQYADAHGIEKLIIRPEYEKYGRAAPIKRNEKMVETADEVLAIWDGRSNGTKYTLDHARKKGKIITEIVIE